MLYFRFFFVALWLPIAFGVGFIAALFQWGNISINRYVSRLFGIPALKMLGIKLQVEGLEDLEKHQPCVYVANHQGALDILTFGAIYPHNCVVIGKKEISYSPILNLYFVAAGNVLVDRQKRASAVASLGKAVDAVKKRNASIWIFAEGTRNRTKEIMLPLKKGAFYMAVEAQIPIVPVVSSLIKPVLDWDRGILKGGTIRMKVLPPIQTKGLTGSDVDRLSVEVRNQMVEAVRGLST
jgi:1-acyl-sn-glycerol-3-phosphate acyltransferase